MLAMVQTGFGGPEVLWSGGLSAVIAAELALDALPAAYDLLADRATIGKILVRP